ncbi:MAG: acetyl-CoA C-acetyltransferase [Oligoflexia bacterium]|nr:acetyl-CoA C-acetyltransferase [Oligoflexia bacterium]
MSSKVYIASAVRTAIGSFGGSLTELAPAELGAHAARAALEQANMKESPLVDEVIVGNVLGAGHGMNISRQVCLRAGLPVSTPAYTVNKVCGSGLKAISLGATEIAAGNYDCVLAGGVESMSQAAFVSLTQRWGARMGNSELKDLMLQDGLTDVFNSCHMGITAENIADKYKISRADQDSFALESQNKAQLAISQGYFKTEILPLPIMKRGKQVGTFDTDEHPRAGVTLESLSALKPAFKKDGSVTAGNASGINDGAAFLVLASEKALKDRNLKPMAEIVGWASAGVEPAIMGTGPIEAVKRVLSKTGLTSNDIDLIEANEAFAVQALAVNRALEFDPQRVNICGGAIALGHPIGASGARILVTLLHQLRRTGKRVGLATLCVGGGQGIAALVKRI